MGSFARRLAPRTHASRSCPLDMTNPRRSSSPAAPPGTSTRSGAVPPATGGERGDECTRDRGGPLECRGRGHEHRIQAARAPRDTGPASRARRVRLRRNRRSGSTSCSGVAAGHGEREGNVDRSKACDRAEADEDLSKFWSGAHRGSTRVVDGRAEVTCCFERDDGQMRVTSGSRGSSHPTARTCHARRRPLYRRVRHSARLAGSEAGKPVAPGEHTNVAPFMALQRAVSA